MAIKEPFFKKANDGFEITRVDDPNDVEFIHDEASNCSTKDGITDVLCIIKNVSVSECSIEVMVLNPVEIPTNSFIYFEYPSKIWNQGRVKDIDKKFIDVFWKIRESNLLFTINFHQYNSTSFVKAL